MSGRVRSQPYPYCVVSKYSDKESGCLYICTSGIQLLKSSYVSNCIASKQLHQHLLPQKRLQGKLSVTVLRLHGKSFKLHVPLFGQILCRKLLTRARAVCGVSFVVPLAIITGAVATRGPTWGRSVRSVTSWCTPTTSVHWTNQTRVREL